MSLTVDGLVTTGWLKANSADPHLRIIDGTWFRPDETSKPQALFVQEHIPGAIWFDIDTISDRASAFPNMLPAADEFAEQVAALGINDRSAIVIYDRGAYAAARVWWMFRVFGYDNVAVLDGGIEKWKADGGAVAAGNPTPLRAVGGFTARKKSHLVRTIDEVKASLGNGDVQIVDARQPEHFAMSLPEVRSGVSPGTIPGSVNIFYARVLNATDRTFLPAGDIESIFRSARIDLEKPIVLSCGAGISACTLALALYTTGRDVPVYDGSWAEWGRDPTNPGVRRTFAVTPKCSDIDGQPS